MVVIGAEGFAGAAARWALERPDAPGIVAADRTWTWRELAGWTSAIAAAVNGAVTADDGAPRPLALEPPMTAAGIAMLHGVASAGAQTVLVPPRWAAPEADALLVDVRPALLLHARDTVGSAGVVSLDVRTLAAAAPGLGFGPVAGTSPRAGGELVVPTSGTTARPRLARLPLDRVDASVRAWHAVLPPATGWLLSLGLAHVAGIGIVARAAALGIPVIVPAAGEDLLDALRRPGVSHASLVATQLARVLDAAADAPPPGELRCVLLGGGPIPATLLVRALDAGWPVWPSYGATETASGVAAARPEDARLHPWSAGVALPGVELRVTPSDPAPAADPEGPAPAPGELQVRGPMVFAGYLDDPAATATRQAPDGWLRTGDLATIDPHGRLRILDRIDDLVISGGENIAPAAIEAVLASLPGVREVAVVGVPDEAWGQVPVAVVVPQPGRDPLDADLLVAAHDRLAGVRRPRHILRSAALPRGGAEKLLRRGLRGPAAAATTAWPPPIGDRGLSLETRMVLADDGQPLLVRVARRAPGDARPAILLLHATLSSSAQLLRLAVELAPHGRVLLPDRRGSGGSRMAAPAPVLITRHVQDAADVLAASGEPDAIVVGHSFGGVVGLELAARRPELVRALVAWEPPYLPLAPDGERDELIRVASRVRRAHAAQGPSGAAQVFMGLVSPGAWERLRPAQQEALGDAGDGVLADAAMPDLDPDGLRRIDVPVVLGTGDASEPFYAPIADALAARIEGATVRSLPGLRHFAPIVNASAVAALVRPFLLPAVDPPSPSQERQP